MKLKEKLLTINKYSRPGIKLKAVKGLVIHWVANPNTTAMANRNFFEKRKHGNDSYGGGHFIIDFNGDIIKCIPPNEMTYHVGSETYTDAALEMLGSYPNNSTIAVECTHLDWEGKMADETYNGLIKICVELCKKYDLNPLNDLWLHHEIVGWKDCHKWFVNHPEEWEEFKQIIYKKMFKNEQENATIKNNESSFEKVDTTHEWKLESLKWMHKKGFITDYQGWKQKIDEPFPSWATMIILQRMYNDLKNK